MIRINKLEEAEKIYTELLSRNPENHLYYQQLAISKGANSSEAKLDLYASLSEKYPKAQSPLRLSLDIASGPKFRELVDIYMKKALRKGIPPLFVDLRPLYEDASKVEILENLCQDYYANLTKIGKFEPDEKALKEPATALLWLLYYMSQHYDHKKDFTKVKYFFLTWIFRIFDWR